MFICCKDTISCKEVHINNECEAVACQISLKYNKNLIICYFYRPPSHDIQCVMCFERYVLLTVAHLSGLWRTLTSLMLIGNIVKYHQATYPPLYVIFL